MIVIADNVQANHGTLQKAVRPGDPGPVRSLARRIEAAGARMLDISVGPPGRDGARKMAFLPMLAAAGLTMVMLNVLHAEAVRLARACESLLSPKVFTWEILSPGGCYPETRLFGRIGEIIPGGGNQGDRRCKRQ